MTVLVSGCSLSTGVGLTEAVDGDYPDCKHSPDLWVNQMFNDVDNIAIGGNTNLRIFQMAASAMLNKHYDLALVQWTSLMRYEWSPGIETWDTTVRSILGSPPRSISLHSGVTLAPDYIQKRFDQFFVMEHAHYRIVQILEYINILCGIAKITKTEIFFVNGLCWWDNNFFDKINYKLPSETTKYTQELLDLPNHSDKEYAKLYAQMHSDYEVAGGIHADRWLNLYDSIHTNRIDRGTDGQHPGVETNKLYAKKFLTKLKNHSTINA
tara:strand:+ start:362 stop:1162 length:801 start_codon:yes stop_codon:yes gene_type:complete